MRAMILERADQELRAASVAVPEPGPSDVLIRVGACGMCRTDLPLVDGELP